MNKDRMTNYIFKMKWVNADGQRIIVMAATYNEAKAKARKALAQPDQEPVLMLESMEEWLEMPKEVDL